MLRPVKTPGSDSGSTTRRQVSKPPAPSDSLASSSRLSICSSTESVAITEKGISTCVRPITTPRSLKISGKRRLDDAGPFQRLVEEALGPEDDQPAVGAHHEADEPRHQHDHQQQIAPRRQAPQQPGDRIGQHRRGDRHDGRDRDGAQEDLVIVGRDRGSAESRPARSRPCPRRRGRRAAPPSPGTARAPAGPAAAASPGFAGRRWRRASQAPAAKPGGNSAEASVSASKASASLIRCASAYHGATKWMPIGRPAFERPNGNR